MVSEIVLGGRRYEQEVSEEWHRRLTSNPLFQSYLRKYPTKESSLIFMPKNVTDCTVPGWTNRRVGRRGGRCVSEVRVSGQVTKRWDERTRAGLWTVNDKQVTRTLRWGSADGSSEGVKEVRNCVVYRRRMRISRTGQDTVAYIDRINKMNYIWSRRWYGDWRTEGSYIGGMYHCY